ncbi:MAG: hypothetical protein Ct9H300mP16_19650 [Pseudomonadota bacterium]|nr:MAG: hypothetical protein Ct9H300mP16_19650 [Pseudomonadota bacterium]
MLRRHKTGAYMFARTNDGGIQGIEVHFARFFDIANNHRSLEKVYVLHRINDTGCIVQIPEGGVRYRLLIVSTMWTAAPAVPK